MSLMTTELRTEPLTDTVLCAAADLEIGWGEAALLPTGQLALYRTTTAYYATSHHCPGSGAKVMARGILGDKLIDGERVATIACPLHKEVFRLDNGAGLSDPSLALPVYPVRVKDGMLSIA